MRDLLIAETSEWLVLNKPAGWLSIPGRSPGIPVLLELAQERWGKLWTVHRIDLETSGVILFARSAEAHKLANSWFQRHQVKKAYDCLAEGAPSAPVLRLKTLVAGAPSTTQVTVLERFSQGFFARAVPLTGRRHQIRIHLADAGYPLFGDSTYGGRRIIDLAAGPLEVGRTALHASRLELPSGEIFEAAWPSDFASWLEVLRGEVVRA